MIRIGALSLTMTVLLAVLCIHEASAAPTVLDVSVLFGTRVIAYPHVRAPFATGDFDGDGVPDSLYVVTIKPDSGRAIIARDVTLVEDLFNGKPIGKNSEKLALAIVLGKDQRKFLLTAYGDGNGFFDTPIWGATPLPLELAKRGSDKFREFAHGEKRIKNDVIVVGTEAGIDTAVYWNGRKFAHYWPPEEP